MHKTGRIACQNCGKTWAREGHLCCESKDLGLWSIRDVIRAEHYGCDPEELYPPVWVGDRLVWAIVAKRWKEAA